jgi:hypothetical protein
MRAIQEEILIQDNRGNTGGNTRQWGNTGKNTRRWGQCREKYQTMEAIQEEIPDNEGNTGGNTRQWGNTGGNTRQWE